MESLQAEQQTIADQIQEECSPDTMPPQAFLDNIPPLPSQHVGCKSVLNDYFGRSPSVFEDHKGLKEMRKNQVWCKSLGESKKRCLRRLLAVGDKIVEMHGQDILPNLDSICDHLEFKCKEQFVSNNNGQVSLAQLEKLLEKSKTSIKDSLPMISGIGPVSELL